jgi:hypothetical protein
MPSACCDCPTRVFTPRRNTDGVTRLEHVHWMCALGSPSSAFGNLAGLPTKMEIRKPSFYPGNLDAGRALVLPKPFCPFNNTAWLLDCAMAARLPRQSARSTSPVAARPSLLAPSMSRASDRSFSQRRRRGWLSARGRCQENRLSG